MLAYLPTAVLLAGFFKNTGQKTGQ